MFNFLIWNLTQTLEWSKQKVLRKNTVSVIQKRQNIFARMENCSVFELIGYFYINKKQYVYNVTKVEVSA